MRRTLTLLVAAGAALAVAFPASAHVTVDAPGATRGGTDQIVNLRVPTESDTLTTVGLKLQLPTDTPFASVLVQPIPGWTFTETTSKLAKPITTDDGTITTAVTEIDWTAAAGSGLKSGEFQDFTFLAGQLPDTASVVFKAIQLYSDGSQVDWIETAAPGSQAQPEHPAPVLSLAAATAPAAAKSSSNTAPVVLSIVALVVAAGALGVAVVSRAKRAST